MLHSKIYNTSYTPDMLEAYRLRDEAALKQMVKDQITALSTADDAEPTYHEQVAVLMCTISLYDSLRGGHACMVIADFVNF